jgi:hypothetical protein
MICSGDFALLDQGKSKLPADNNTSRVLGVAFLLQACTSLISGLILKVALIVPGNISASMLNIANHTWLMRASILGEMITAVGIIFLGAVLFVVLREANEKTALVALGFYILEAALLAVSRIAAFPLLRISQEYVSAGHRPDLLAMANLELESIDSGYTLLMFPFCLGAILFYYLFYKTRVVPRALSLWGLIAVSLVLIGTLFAICGHEVPFVVLLPYVPFEFVIGVWILVKGISEQGVGRRA